MTKIEVHADDFGESLNASRDILECVVAGKLTGISVLSNMSCFEECVSLYREMEENFVEAPKLSVHLNIMEGKCLAEREKVANLIDNYGHFNISWGTLFVKSFLPGSKSLKDQLKLEIYEQIMAVWKAFPEIKYLRIDSHQHTHMIPIVAKALFEVLEEEKWDVEYIRDSSEPLVPFLKELSLYSTYRPVNFIKNIILKFCSLLMKKRMRKYNMKPMMLWGLIMSGHMDEKRVKKLLSGMSRIAEKKGCVLEILFHPGLVMKEEIADEFSQKEAIAFHTSSERAVEKSALLNMVC